MSSTEKDEDSSALEYRTKTPAANDLEHKLSLEQQNSANSPVERAGDTEGSESEFSAPSDSSFDMSEVDHQDQGVGNTPELDEYEASIHRLDVQSPTRSGDSLEQAKIALRQMASALDQHIAIYLGRLQPSHPPTSRPPTRPSASRHKISPTVLEFQTIRTPSSRSTISTLPKTTEGCAAVLRLPLVTGSGKVLRPDQVFYAIRLKFHNRIDSWSRTTMDLAPLARTAGEAVEMLGAIVGPQGWMPDRKVVTRLCFLDGRYHAGPTIRGSLNWPHIIVEAFIMQTWVRDVGPRAAAGEARSTEGSDSEMGGVSGFRGRESTDTRHARRRKSAG